MRVLVTGASGLVGAALGTRLQAEGHTVTPLVRGQWANTDQPSWDPQKGRIELGKGAPFEAFVHLAGENIAAGRWTVKQKRAIRDSRVDGTRLLCEAIAKLEEKPRVLICASAIGFYGERGDTELDETSPSGTGFLPDVCREWEEATQPAIEVGVRVVHLRIGVVLASEGGALAKMLTPFKMGVGGVIGNGRQYMSWISLTDVVRVIQFALRDETLQGPVNTVAPGAVTNREFTKTLGKTLGRPTIFPMPAFAAKLAFGEMAEALLLGSTRVTPKRLTDAGFSFEHPQLSEALSAILK